VLPVLFGDFDGMNAKSAQKQKAQVAAPEMPAESSSQSEGDSPSLPPAPETAPADASIAQTATATGEGEVENSARPTPEPDPTVPIQRSDFRLTEADLMHLNTRRGLTELLRSKRIRLRRVVGTLRYEDELKQLQVELVKLQRWVQDKGKRLAIVFEGRDAAGKGGTIRRFTQHLNPRAMRVVALPKPTKEETGQWYFQRYARQLPNAGEIVFFDRSWYNRAVVEPVNSFCTQQSYQQFMRQVPEFEHMLYEDGVLIIKFWFSISKAEQLRRFEARKQNPLKQWKFSPVDEIAQDRWEVYTRYKEEMFARTHTAFSPWIIVRANNKRKARVESMRYVLNLLPYAGKNKAGVTLNPDPNIITRYHREAGTLD
jgi:polyphosphate kinase 2